MKKHIKHKLSATLLILTFTLGACGNDGGEDNSLPKTYEVYQKKFVLSIRGLKPEEKQALYTDTANFHKAKLANVSENDLFDCLDVTLKEHSSFMSFAKIYGICEKKLTQ